MIAVPLLANAVASVDVTLPDATKAVATVMQAWADTALDIAILFAAAGTMSMALVDLVKGVFRLRGHYHKRAVDQWVRCNSDARMQLIALAAAGAEYEAAWWDQATAQLFARLRAAADTALDFPQDFSALYDHLIDKIGVGQSTEDGRNWKEIAPFWRGQPQPVPDQKGAPAAPQVTPKVKRSSPIDPADLRARLGMAVSRHIDAVEMGVEWRWAKLVQSVAVPVGAVLFYVIQAGSGIPQFWAVAMSLFAGLLAPFAKDVVDRLSGVSLAGRFGIR